MKSLLTSASLALVPLLGACQSVEGLLSVQGHAPVWSDTSLDSSDVDTEGWGAQVVVQTPLIDATLDYDMREYDDAEGDEIALGARYRFLSGLKIHPYVAAKLRYGDGLDVGPLDSDEYYGAAIGGGLLFWLWGGLYLQGDLSYEWLLDDIDVGGAQADLDGFVGTLGLGWSF